MKILCLGLLCYGLINPLALGQLRAVGAQLLLGFGELCVMACT